MQLLAVSFKATIFGIFDFDFLDVCLHSSRIVTIKSVCRKQLMLTMSVDTIIGSNDAGNCFGIHNITAVMTGFSLKTIAVI